MPKITGTVLDHNNIPIPNASVLLTGGGVAIEALLTDVNGKFSFIVTAPGNYKVSVVYTPFNYISEKIVLIAEEAIADSVIEFTINTLVDKPTTKEDILSYKYLPLKYLQYLFLALIGWYFFYKLIGGGLPDLINKLNNVEIARGTITYLVAVTTIAMAALLMLAAIMTGGKDLEKRFSLGKEILTLLIGILGTIIGFYFGSSDVEVDRTIGETEVPAETTQSSEVKVQDIEIDPSLPQIGSSFTLNANLLGGTKPYTYSIHFTPTGVVNQVNNRISENGNIIESITVSDSSNVEEELKYIIEGHDYNKVKFSNQGSIKLSR